MQRTSARGRVSSVVSGGRGARAQPAASRPEPGEEVHQRVERGQVQGVVHPAALATIGDEAGVLQALQMERQPDWPVSSESVRSHTHCSPSRSSSRSWSRVSSLSAWKQRCACVASRAAAVGTGRTYQTRLICQAAPGILTRWRAARSARGWRRRRTRAAIAAIYNEGIADRVATFETEPRTEAQIEAQLADKGDRFPTVVAEREGQIVAWASAGPYRSRPAYAGVAEHSVYVARAARGTGAGRAALEALCRAYAERGFWKIVSRIFPGEHREPRAARALRVPRGRRVPAPRQARRRMARLRDRGEDARRGRDARVTHAPRRWSAMCAAQACAQIGAFSVAALLPTLIPAWSPHQHRGRLDQRHLLRGLHARGAAALVADRPGGRQAHLSRLGRAHRARLRRLRLAGHGLLVGAGVPRPDGHRLGRQLHARAQGAQRRHRGPAAVAGRRRPCRGRRRQRRALVRRGRRGQRVARLALGAGAGRARRGAGLRARADRPAGPRRRVRRPGRAARCSTSGRSSATARRSPTRSPTACTPGRCRRCGRGSSPSSRSPRAERRRLDAARARHRGERDGAARRVGERLGQRALHPVRAAPVHPRHHARLGGDGGRRSASARRCRTRAPRRWCWSTRC